MPQSHEITIKDAHVEVAGSVISGDINVQMPNADVTLHALQQRLTDHRRQIPLYEQSMEQNAAKGYIQTDAPIRLIGLNAATTKAYINVIIPEILNRGGRAEFIQQDIEIDSILTRAFEQGRKHYLRKRRGRGFLRLGVIVIALLLVYLVYGIFQSYSSSATKAFSSTIAPTVVIESSATHEALAPTVVQTNAKRMIVTVNALNIRATPSGDGAIVGKLFQGDVVLAYVDASTNGNWIRVSFTTVKKETVEGWVNKSYLTLE